MRQTLIPHPDSQCPAVKWIVVEAARPTPTALKLRYMLAGTIAELRLPPWAGAARTDKLWEHTCFELFLRPDATNAYLEFNFSPSTQWAAWRFRDKRNGKDDAADSLRPTIRFLASVEGITLTANVENLPPTEMWQIGLSAVIEEKSGRKSYWALAHPPGEPDFHDPDCFTLELPAAPE